MWQIGYTMPELILPDGTLADRINLSLNLVGTHGVFDFEKENTQPFNVDVTAHLLPAPHRYPGVSDSLADTLHYGELAEHVAAIVEGDSVDLIETLAEKIAIATLDLGAVAADVTVHKPQAPVDNLDDVSVQIRRLSGLLTTPVPHAHVVIGIGSNINPVDNVEIASGRLARILDRERRSRTLVTAPLAGHYAGPQDNYVNAVMVGYTPLSPLEFLNELHRIENQAGRIRKEKWGPRTLDLDLISYRVDHDEITSDHPYLTLPHPQARHRAFVTGPWKELEPDAVLNGEPL